MNAVIPNAGVHHIAIRTFDYQNTLDFYTNLLGMTPVVDWEAPDGRKLALVDIGDGTCIEIIAFTDAERHEGGQQHPWMHLALATTEPDAVWQRAIDAGYESVIDPKDVKLGGIDARIAFFQGPNGEVIELFRQR